MKPNCKKAIYGQLNTVDRFSDLPDCIIHRIVSFLDTREACRTSILSKRWVHIWATNPIVEFHYYCKAKKLYSRYWPSKEVSARLLEYIDTRMQRYSDENLRIKTLRLRFPDSNKVLGCDVEELELSRKFEELSCKVDEWIRIAVRNQVASLDLDGPNKYRLPNFLFSAKSLRQLDCIDVKIPYYDKPINLASLQTLVLQNVVVEERMLNHIMSSCLLLKCLSFTDCFGFKTIVIPCRSQLKELSLFGALPKNRKIILETSSLTSFKFSDMCLPVTSKPGLLRNLRELYIFSSGITGADLGKLLPELASLETLHLFFCHFRRNFKISCIQLKKIYLYDCDGYLLNVAIDTPSLTEFKYKGDFEPFPVSISSQASCDIDIEIPPYFLDTRVFFKLKKLMTGLKSCNALKISLTHAYEKSSWDDIKFDEEELGDDVILGPPCDITELKLSLANWKLSKSSISVFLNGLFWMCHPDIISFRVHLEHPNLTIEPLMSELQKMAKCWSHPLKRIEVEGSNCSNLLESNNLDVQLRLYW